jgi:Xaa-Pro aminopeptidase
MLESELGDVRRMSSFRDVAATIENPPGTLYLDMSFATMEWHSYLSRCLKFEHIRPVDAVCLEARAVKSGYELERMRESGRSAGRLLCEEAPALLREGISEAEFAAELYALLVKNGHHGVSRFLMRNVDVVLGHIGFGPSVLYPSVFDGASGTVGLCPAAPVLGSNEVKLKKGDLVYVDIVFGVDGYHTDKTQIYSFGAPPPDSVLAIHRHLTGLEREAAAMLCPGARPCDIYEAILARLDPKLKDCFMGPPGHTVPFLGHGVGLFVDEYPVLTGSFTRPLENGMTIAVEPKAGLEGVGMVGSENTYLVTDHGGEALTGEPQDIVVC